MISGPHNARKPPRPPGSSGAVSIVRAPGCIEEDRRGGSAGGTRFAAAGKSLSLASTGALAGGVAVAGAIVAGGTADEVPVAGAAVPATAAAGAAEGAAAGCAAALFFLALPSPLAVPAFFAVFFTVFFTVFFAVFLVAFFAAGRAAPRTDPGASSPGPCAESLVVLSSIIALALPVDGRFDGNALPACGSRPSRRCLRSGTGSIMPAVHSAVDPGRWKCGCECG